MRISNRVILGLLAIVFTDLKRPATAQTTLPEVVVRRPPPCDRHPRPHSQLPLRPNKPPLLRRPPRFGPFRNRPLRSIGPGIKSFCRRSAPTSMRSTAQLFCRYHKVKTPRSSGPCCKPRGSAKIPPRAVTCTSATSMPMRSTVSTAFFSPKAFKVLARFWRPTSSATWR
jgi:hypothetical protein